MHCHGSQGALAPASDGGPIVLVGSPNVGKSVLFGLLTGRYVAVSNYPSTTVEVARGQASIDGRRETVVGFGLGPAAGALAAALYTVGYLGKLYYEAFEAADPEVLEAVRSVGSSRPQLLSYAVLPEAANTVISQLLFMFEYNIRASTIMGFVGAGGIGFYVLGYLQLLQYQNLMTAILLTFAVVMAVDYLSARLRSLILPSMQRSPARAPLLAGLTALWK